MRSAVSHYSRTVSESFARGALGFSIFLSVLLIACGFLGIVLPLESFRVLITQFLEGCHFKMHDLSRFW